jgi:hypothetical protein
MASAHVGGNVGSTLQFGAQRVMLCERRGS